MSLNNNFHWSYKCTGCNHYNKCCEEDHDFFDTIVYEFEETCGRCGKNHNIEIYCKPGKDSIIFINGVEQK